MVTAFVDLETGGNAGGGVCGPEDPVKMFLEAAADP